jgi:hypothetical protein
MRPLADLLVLDFSTLLPGPMATLLLAEAGAEVVKIERPGTGEEMRTYHPRWGRNSANFALLNRGKTSLALDLKVAADRAHLDRLIDRADILVEQFRPRVMARLGLDAATLAKRNPRLIYCSITGYGQSGPKRDLAAHDLNYIADAGLLALSCGPAETPVIPPALIADIAGGAYPAVMNILLALRERETTGLGCYLDVAMADNLFPFMYWAMATGLATGQWPGTRRQMVTCSPPHRSNRSSGTRSAGSLIYRSRYATIAGTPQRRRRRWRISSARRKWQFGQHGSPVKIAAVRSSPLFRKLWQIRISRRVASSPTRYAMNRMPKSRRFRCRSMRHSVLLPVRLPRSRRCNVRQSEGGTSSAQLAHNNDDAMLLRSWNFWILPLAVRGISSMISNRSGK